MPDTFEQNNRPELAAEDADRLSPAKIGEEFNRLESDEFIDVMRKRAREHPSMRFVIVADWVDVHKARSAKAFWDLYASRWRLDSFTQHLAGNALRGAQGVQGAG